MVGKIVKTATGLGRFQKNRGLKPDGLLNPKGPTIRKLEGEGGFAGKARALQAALPKLSGEAYAANGRTVKTLLKRSGYGDMPTYMSDAWGGDDKGKAEVTDLLGQLEDAAPKAAGALRNQLAQKLAPAERGLLFAAAAIRRLAEDDEKPDEPDKPEKEPDEPPRDNPEPAKEPEPEQAKEPEPESESDASLRCLDKQLDANNAWKESEDTTGDIRKEEAKIKTKRKEIEALRAKKGGSGIDEAPPILKRPKGPMDALRKIIDLAFWVNKQQERQRKDLVDIDAVKAQIAKLEAEIKALETKVGKLKERKKREERHAILLSDVYDHCLKNPPIK